MRVALALLALGSVWVLAGCGSSEPSASDDKALRQALSKPPSLAGMKPKGAKQTAEMQAKDNAAATGSTGGGATSPGTTTGN